MPLWWLPAAIQGAATLGKYIYDRNKRTPDFSSTAYGRYLKHKSQVGIYPETVKEKILSQIGAEAGNVGQQQRAIIRGQLLSKGMGGSVAGVRMLNEPSQDRMRGIITARKQLEIENEMSKQQAGEQLAMGETQIAEQQRAEKRANVGGLIGGVVSAGTSLAGGYYQQKQFAQEMGLKKEEMRLKRAEYGLKEEDIGLKALGIEMQKERNRIRGEYETERNRILEAKDISDIERKKQLDYTNEKFRLAEFELKEKEYELEKYKAEKPEKPEEQYDPKTWNAYMTDIGKRIRAGSYVTPEEEEWFNKYIENLDKIDYFQEYWKSRMEIPENQKSKKADAKARNEIPSWP